MVFPDMLAELERLRRPTVVKFARDQVETFFEIP